MEKNSIIQKITHAKPWPGREQTLYFHELIMQNGDEGKLQGNTEESPAWLFVGAAIKYDITQGKYNSYKNKYDMNIKLLGMNSSNNANYDEQNNSIIPPPQRKNNPNQPEFKRNYNPKYSDDPAFRLKQQKCISLTTCLDRANELVVAGKIDLKKKHAEAFGDFIFIMKHAGIEEVEPESSNETVDMPNHPLEKTEFADGANLFIKVEEPISRFVQEAINRCSTAKQISNLKSQLMPEEINNKTIQDAIHNKSVELKTKKQK